MISSSCGTRAVSLRARTPFVRSNDADRLVIETDAPSTGGKLLLDLVPGPVSVQGEPVLPNAIRATVSTDVVGNSIVELVPDGTAIKSLPAALPGVTVRWELVLTPGGVQVHRDGEIVATSPFVPQWREATALVGVAALAGDRIRAGVDLIGFRAGNAEAPPNVPTPNVRVDAAPGTQDPDPERHRRSAAHRVDPLTGRRADPGRAGQQHRGAAQARRGGAAVEAGRGVPGRRGPARKRRSRTA